MKNSIEVTAPNGKVIGKAILLEDGFYHFDMLGIPGYWDEHSLRYVADKLEELNGPYNEELKRYFDAEKQRDLQKNYDLVNQSYNPPYFNRPSARDRGVQGYM